VFPLGTPSKAGTFAALLPQNRPVDLTAHRERPGHRTLVSADDLVNPQWVAPQRCPPPLHQADRIMANRRDPVNLRRRGVSPPLATSLPTILSTPFA
jgi:hypothetical protein